MTTDHTFPHQNRFLLWLLLFFLAISPIGYSITIDEVFELAGMFHLRADEHGVYWGPGARVGLHSPLWQLSIGVDFVNDDVWRPQEGWMPDGFYWDLLYSYVQFFPGPFTLEGGFIPATHLYSQNPFAMILDGAGKPALGAAYTYQGRLFTFQNRWIGLNSDSPFTYGYGEDPGSIPGSPRDSRWQDRGFYHRLYTLNLGNLRLGYQESSISMGRYFDPNFFLNPAPSILVNTIWSQGNNPWVHRHNDASFMGFYADYTAEQFRLEGEFMIMDVNLPFGYPDNLNKFGWSFGGSLATNLGNFAFWHGGATKHMFAATYTSSSNPNLHPYEYTYFPVSRLGGRDIPLESNYIGFPYGENALAFQIEWDNQFTPGAISVDQGVSFRYVLSGSKSPHNPWHEDSSWRDIDRKTELFHGDSILEHRLLLESSTTLRYRNFFSTIQLGLGGIINPLQLVEQGTDPPIWKPLAGTRNMSFLRLTLGYSFNLP